MPAKLKLNKFFIEEAAKLIEAGVHQRHVAQALGIHEATWYRWLQEGENAKSGIKREFYEAIKKAEGRAIVRNIAQIQKAAQEGNWQAAAWWLERRYPDEYGKKEKTTIATDGEGIVININKVSNKVSEGKNADD